MRLSILFLLLTLIACAPLPAPDPLIRISVGGQQVEKKEMIAKLRDVATQSLRKSIRNFSANDGVHLNREYKPEELVQSHEEPGESADPNGTESLEWALEEQFGTHTPAPSVKLHSSTRRPAFIKKNAHSRVKKPFI